MLPSKRSSTNTSAGTAPRAKRSRSSTATSMAISDSVALPEKPVGPDTVLQFAGITLDSVLFEARLPEDMLTKCRVMLHNFYTRGTVTLKELHGMY